MRDVEMTIPDSKLHSHRRPFCPVKTRAMDTHTLFRWLRPMNSFYRSIKCGTPPSGWDPQVKYIDSLAWAPSVPSAVHDLLEPRHGQKTESSHVQNSMVDVRGMYPSLKEQRRTIKIKSITDKKHPCCGAYGLFAAQTLQPHQLVLDYLGVVEYQTHDTASDYVLHFGNGISIDANVCGNEARFCNDFRGIGSAPNVCFQTYQHEQTKRIRIGIFVLGKGKIRKGEELLISYGKSFWSTRGIDMSHQNHSNKE
ncbi:hypothetical protein BDF14DRAFT_1780660 [Spinellus fusiger]|nr:hypothetical protein BDF14DRAFT_1780660 [Spinellus fusiger]